ncbi:Geranylgeranyl diphosphate synthase [Minicystis rosea]|nr:Geranylgeranyl diphosphate synthase [Minicystis rosea]
MRHAVFPGGARIRPRLCLAVAAASGDPLPVLGDAAAAAIELIHCASLVHDDLPCFDNASTRRGRPAVHRAHGEPLAVLAGDALIVAAFETVARAARAVPDRMGALVEVIARGVASPHGIIAGQAWESEPHIPVITYRRAKTAALFEAAAAAGAVVAGADPAAWRLFGERIGEAYQVADDIQDVSGDPAALGKPVGRDAVLGRPNAARDLGAAGSRELMEQLVREALSEMPPCRRPEEIRGWASDMVLRLLAAGRPSREAAGEPVERIDHEAPRM